MSSINAPEIDRLITNIRAVEREVYPKAASRALNRTATSVRTQASRSVAKAMGLTIAPVRKKFFIEKAKPSRLTAIVSAVGRPISLIHFAARQVRKGVTAKAWGKRKLYRGAFIAKAKTRSAGEEEFRPTADQVFVREGKMRLPIKKLWGPGIPQTLAEPEIQTEIEKQVLTQLPQRIEKEIAFYAARELKRRITR